MRSGMALESSNTVQLSSEEEELVRHLIRDGFIKPVSEWIVRQKPKLRSKFIKFLSTVIGTYAPNEGGAHSSNVAERFAKDIMKQEYHPVIRVVIENDGGEFSDILHILSLHMSRTNVMASTPSVRDPAPKLLKAIAQEDHLFMSRRKTKHAMPEPVCAEVVTRATLNQKLEVKANTRAQSFKPEKDKSSPFAMFPSGEVMESTTHAQFHKYDKLPEREKIAETYKLISSKTVL